jgi:hypothetical protein
MKPTSFELKAQALVPLKIHHENVKYLVMDRKKKDRKPWNAFKCVDFPKFNFQT